MKFGLSDEIIKIITDYFTSVKEIETVKIYGSRAKGNFANGSDIDFALFGKTKCLENKIGFELDELPTPYKFDVIDYETIENKELKSHIDRVGKIFYKKV